ncbi:zinc metalloproteinase nas-14-like [Malaya genurostris]|uniref:zinc metalloproteinase nas-14-like n=1 Tax=Malaya genurostris TaxID=325434 RepID=UPI0026F38E67|nr:zinc metalloproteinase nas-14-like [Malaya genurostris]
MKILEVGLHILSFWVFVTSGLLYHRYEEISRKTHGDLVLNTDVDPETGIRGIIRSWSQSTVPYLLVGNITSEQENIIREAMNEIQEVSCVRFVERDASNKNFVIISLYKSGCWSALGMLGGAQDLNLDPRGCMTKGAILHQLMHTQIKIFCTLGFSHPSSRSDRDFYVSVVSENINSHDLVHLDKASPGEYVDFGIPYDFDSIMHRSGWAFSANGKQTIKALDANVDLGQREKLSFKDIRQLNKMYQCVKN